MNALITSVMLRGLALIGLMLPFSEANAIMDGMPAVGVSTVQLVFEHRTWREYAQEWKISHSQCSAVVVGVAPLTLLTAAHCLREVSLNPVNQLPLVRIAQADQPAIQSAILTQAIFPEFDKVRGNLIDDLAVLVFDLQLTDTKLIAPVLLDHPQARALLCGYGFGASDNPPDILRCASKTLHEASAEFSAFVPARYEALDPLFYARYRTQFESKASAISTLDTLLAVNRLDHEGEYIPSLPMPTLGDSGGPWLADLGEGRYVVMGVTSFVESFYSSSPQWGFFRQSNAPMADFMYAGYGIRLDSMRARKLFNAARIRGADIRVYRQGWEQLESRQRIN
ncbi:S1 family peptidase [Methylobacillus gramineus]|uniref:S1 family peptidase n=1 Tax=Methylobacillus gramineus TaxID=755169 RepID=UPI001CFF700C|nr:S1 family peptidase [Methylobacillus gramineus]MCB5185191.1 S1 family peptidase [Methylobacillus gramineus]